MLGEHHRHEHSRDILRMRRVSLAGIACGGKLVYKVVGVEISNQHRLSALLLQAYNDGPI